MSSSPDSRAFEISKEDFSLLETLLWEPADGWFLLDRHLQRIEKTARFFGYMYSEPEVRSYLDQLSQSFLVPKRVRLLVNKTGAIESRSTEVIEQDKPLKLAVAESPVNSEDIFLRHKTTRRAIYDAFLNKHLDADDVILWNEREELTECCRGNICLKIDDAWVTPHLKSGLLAGTFRDHLIQKNQIKERLVTLDALKDADEIVFINSVRKWCPTTIFR